MDTTITILALLGAGTTAVATTAGAYAAFLTLTGGRQKLKWDRLLSYGVLTPTLWIGMTAITTTIGIALGLLPNSSSSALTGSLLSLLPSSWLAHSVLTDIDAASSVSVSLGGKTSPKSPPPPRKRTRSHHSHHHH